MSKDVALKLFTMGTSEQVQAEEDKSIRLMRATCKAGSRADPDLFKSTVVKGIALHQEMQGVTANRCRQATPSGFALYFEDAYCAFLSRGLKGERSYRALFAEMEMNRAERLTFFRHPENV